MDDSAFEDAGVRPPAGSACDLYPWPWRSPPAGPQAQEKTEEKEGEEEKEEEEGKEADETSSPLPSFSFTAVDGVGSVRRALWSGLDLSRRGVKRLRDAMLLRRRVTVDEAQAGPSPHTRIKP